MYDLEDVSELSFEFRDEINGFLEARDDHQPHRLTISVRELDVFNNVAVGEIVVDLFGHRGEPSVGAVAARVGKVLSSKRGTRNALADPEALRNDLVRATGDRASGFTLLEAGPGFARFMALGGHLSWEVDARNDGTWIRRLVIQRA